MVGKGNGFDARRTHDGGVFSQVQRKMRGSGGAATVTQDVDALPGMVGLFEDGEGQVQVGQGNGAQHLLYLAKIGRV